MSAAQVFKQAAKRWVRPPLMPVVRACVRYAPNQSVRQAMWMRVVEPFFLHSQTDFVTTTTFGATIAGNTKDLIQRHIFYFGSWEPNLTDFLRGRLRAGDVFVDVGANIGYFTLLASGLVGRSGKVIAIEASPRIFAKLTDNLARNRTTNTEAINAAVSDHQGTVQIFIAADSNIGATSLSSREGSHYECDVASDTLDAFLTNVDVANVRFIKIDVEGAEWLVLSGMRELLKRAGANLEILVELMPKALHAYGKSIEQVFELFAEHGFLPYHIKNDYSTLSYMSTATLNRPVRVRTPLSEHADVIFSKIDADYL